MRTGIMFDTETLGRKPDSVVLQLALVAFDLDTGVPIPSALGVLHYTSCIDITKQPKRVIYPDTLKWWLHPERIQTFQLLSSGTANIVDVLWQAVKFIRNLKPEEVWCRGTDFDIPLLYHMLEISGNIDEDERGFPYYAIRDLRTACGDADLSREEVKELRKVMERVEHDAYDDCIVQIATYREVRKRLKENRGEAMPKPSISLTVGGPDVSFASIQAQLKGFACHVCNGTGDDPEQSDDLGAVPCVECEGSGMRNYTPTKGGSIG